jgi:cytochrome c biogenesis protein CcmG, thiol:disulfide interchange protein DsbE
MSRTAARMLAGATVALVCALALGACGSDGGDEYGSPPPNYEEALAGAPPALARLYEQPNKLLPGGVDAFERRLRELRGHPVVVNKWASWCGPCRAEFPFLQRATVRFGERVAFLGVDSEESDDTAKQFLSEFPVPYPSYTDPDQDIAQSFKATLGFPSTAFYSPSGELVFLKQGGYASEEDLFADIRRYALGAG